MVKRDSVDGGMNITTALLLLVMLLVVVTGLLTYMLYDSQNNLNAVKADDGSVHCILVSVTPTPIGINQ